MTYLKEIAEYREKHGVGLYEAQRVVKQRRQIAELQALREGGSSDAKINWLLDRYEEQFLKSS